LTARKEAALFRIAQEALPNAVKHARGSKVTITLAGNGRTTRLALADNGQRFLLDEASLPRSGAGWGLTSMRERAESIGGVFRVRSVLGEGTLVGVEVTARQRQPD